MTIPAASPTFVQIPGNGFATNFAAPMKCFQSTDVAVGFIIGASYSRQFSGYSITNIDNNGGFNVLFIVAPPVGTLVDIRTNTPQTQGTEFSNLGSYLPENTTECFDRLTREMQDLTRLTYQFGMHGPDAESVPWPALPAPSTRAGMALIFDNNGLPTLGIPVTGTISTSVLAPFLGLSQTAAEAAASVTPTALQYQPGDVRRYGALGDNATNDQPAFAKALLAYGGQTITVTDPPGGAWLIGSALTVPTNTTIQGSNKRTCKILCGGNFNLLTFNDGVCMYDVDVEGNATTGHGVLIASGQGNQTIQNCRITNFAVGTGGGVLHYADNTAGSRISVHDCEMWQTGVSNGTPAATGTGLYAIYVPDVFQAAAVPHKYSHIETSGSPAFFFGGCDDVFITGSFLGDLNFSVNSSSVHMAACRIANQTALTIKGQNHTLVGGDWLPQITLDSSLTNSVIGPFSNDPVSTAPIIDNTGANNNNQVFQARALYTPTFSASGGGASLGSSTIQGFFSRSGSQTFYVIELTVASGFNPGTGGLQFSLPVAKQDGEVITSGTGYLTHSGTQYPLLCQIPNNVGFVTVSVVLSASALSAPSTISPVTGTVPVTLATGDTIRISGSYEP